MAIFISDNNTIKWNYNGIHYCLHIHSDDEPCDPRKDYDNAATMACWHRQYSIGDDVKESSPEFFWNRLVGDHIPEEAQRKIILSGELSYQIREIEGKYYIYLDDKEEYGPYDTADEAFSDYYCDLIPIKDCMKMLEPCLVWLPLWLYDHSGITMSCGKRTWPYNDRWDSGCVGYIILTKDAAFENLHVTEGNWRDKAIAVMEAEVETYDQYLRGEVYGYTLYEESDGEWEEIEEVGGFFGSDLLENGIADECPGLSEAIQSGEYEEGTAELHTASWYTF